jgi:hypothetical protein
MQYGGAPIQSNNDAMLNKAIERMQIKEATKTYNSVVERCFEVSLGLLLLFSSIIMMSMFFSTFYFEYIDSC